MKDYVNTTNKSGIPVFFVALGAIGCAIFVLGLAAQFAGVELMRPEAAVEDYPLMMIIIGFNFMIPFVLQKIKKRSLESKNKAKQP